MITYNKELRQKMNQIIGKILKMCHQIYKRRPTCAKLLSEYAQWGIDENEVKKFSFYQDQLFVVRSNPNTFFCKFLTTKLNLVR